MILKITTSNLAVHCRKGLVSRWFIYALFVRRSMQTPKFSKRFTIHIQILILITVVIKQYTTMFALRYPDGSVFQADQFRPYRIAARTSTEACRKMFRGAGNALGQHPKFNNLSAEMIIESAFVMTTSAWPHRLDLGTLFFVCVDTSYPNQPILPNTNVGFRACEAAINYKTIGFFHLQCPRFTVPRVIFSSHPWFNTEENLTPFCPGFQQTFYVARNNINNQQHIQHPEIQARRQLKCVHILNKFRMHLRTSIRDCMSMPEHILEASPNLRYLEVARHGRLVSAWITSSNDVGPSDSSFNNVLDVELDEEGPQVEADWISLWDLTADREVARVQHSSQANVLAEPGHIYKACSQVELMQSAKYAPAVLHLSFTSP